MGAERKTIGTYIAETRIACGLTQKELAEEIGMTPQYLAKIENGYRRPKINTVMEIRNALYLRASKFIGTLGFEIASEALTHLFEMIDIEYGLGIFSKPKTDESHNSLTLLEQQFLDLLNDLNSDGIAVAFDRVKELAEIPRYKKTASSEADEKKE